MRWCCLRQSEGLIDRDDRQRSISISTSTVGRVRSAVCEAEPDADSALNERTRPGTEPTNPWTADRKRTLIAVACSDAPLRGPNTD